MGQYYKLTQISYKLLFVNFPMENQIICPNCNEQYRDDNLPRLLIGCGHTYCETCLLNFIYEQDGLLWTRCPDDGNENEVKDRNVSLFPKNLALIKVIQNKKEGLAFKENQINVSKITKNSSVHEEEDTTELINFMDSSKNNSSSPHSRAEKQQKRVKKSNSPKESRVCVCPVHRKPMDIVCTVDLTKICASCAIFGDHRGHSFKSLEEVSQIQNQYCDSIISIINEKEKLSKQISCSETKNDLIGLLTTKRNKLRTKIMEEFQKIETKLNTKKKQTLKKLDQIVKKQQSNLRNCMKFDQHLMKSYAEWYKKSDSQLKILEENDFEAKLILLFEGKNIDGDLVEEGESIIEQMKVEQENILCQVEKKLENLSVNINEDIYNVLDDFINVTGENYKQISAITVKTQTVKLPPSIQRPGKSSIASQKMRLQIPQKRIEMIPKYESNKNSYLQVIQTPNTNTNLDESLLQNDQEAQEADVFQFSLRMSQIVPPNKFRTAPLSERLSIQPNIETPIEKALDPKLKGLKSPTNELMETKAQKMSKKKLSKMKLPERYEKIVESLLSDSLEILDLTNAQIGDSSVAAICQNIKGSKVRTLKLIRNKLSDEGVSKILPFLGSITTLNLSQNLLTDNILDILYQNKRYLPALRTVILSQNKIVERKHKSKIDRVKKLEWNVSI